MKRVLIVEDDIDLCLELSDFLNEFGFDTAVATDGLRALAILADCDPLPNIIILDLHMPNMDGWTLRESLKNHQKYASIPVLVMSGDEACFSVNAEAHFLKPIDLRQVVSVLLKQ